MRSLTAIAMVLMFTCSAAMAPADLVQTIDAHFAAVNCLDVTPDDDMVISGGKDGRVKLWDAATFELVQEVPACQVAINDVIADPMGEFFITAGKDGFVKLWDAYNFELIVAINAHEGGANTLAIYPEQDDNPYFYTAGEDGFVRCWEIDGDQFPMVWEGFAHDFGVNDILLNQTGDYLFSGGADGKVAVFDALIGAQESSITAFERAEVLCMVMPVEPTVGQEPCLYTGGSNGELKCWDAATGSLVRTTRAHAGNVNHLAFSELTGLVVSGGEDGKLKLWNHDGDLAGQMQAHVLGIRDFLMTGDMLFTGGADYKLRVWESNF